MMDGRVGAIRGALDERGFDGHRRSWPTPRSTPRGFYGPFREAADSAPQFGDRRGYQMDPANVREALREVALDVEEGADIVMVKPALAYLDVIAEVKRQLRRAGRRLQRHRASTRWSRPPPQNGWIDGNRVMMEVLTSIKRAGADMILTYHALDAAKLLGA